MTIQRQFFDEIVNGSKKIEYRDIKPYWTKRLEGRAYSEVLFRNGYAPDAPRVRVEYNGFVKTDLYEIQLGKVLEVMH